MSQRTRTAKRTLASTAQWLASFHGNLSGRVEERGGDLDDLYRVNTPEGTVALDHAIDAIIGWRVEGKVPIDVLPFSAAETLIQAAGISECSKDARAILDQELGDLWNGNPALQGRRKNVRVVDIQPARGRQRLDALLKTRLVRSCTSYEILKVLIAHPDWRRNMLVSTWGWHPEHGKCFVVYPVGSQLVAETVDVYNENDFTIRYPLVAAGNERPMW